MKWLCIHGEEIQYSMLTDQQNQKLKSNSWFSRSSIMEPRSMIINVLLCWEKIFPTFYEDIKCNLLQQHSIWNKTSYNIIMGIIFYNLFFMFYSMKIFSPYTKNNWIEKKYLNKGSMTQILFKFPDRRQGRMGGRP